MIFVEEQLPKLCANNEMGKNSRKGKSRIRKTGLLQTTLKNIKKGQIQQLQQLSFFL